MPSFVSFGDVLVETRGRCGGWRRYSLTGDVTLNLLWHTQTLLKQCPEEEPQYNTVLYCLFVYLFSGTETIFQKGLHLIMYLNICTISYQKAKSMLVVTFFNTRTAPKEANWPTNSLNHHKTQFFLQATPALLLHPISQIYSNVLVMPSRIVLGDVMIVSLMLNTLQTE